MIKANELMIGNRILVDRVNDELPWETTVIGVEEFQVTVAIIPRGGTSVNPEEIHPIPITPEWLERCGFEYKEPHCIKRPLSIAKNFYRDGTWNYDGFVLRHKFEDCMQVLVIKYLHQLQNLYFALTGTEITIKL
jgi:hypothetical protein